MKDDLKLVAILVAAGPSTRLGQPKQLVEWNGETLVRRAARLLSSLASGPVVAVTGCEKERVAAQFEGLAVEPSYNPDWKLGMGGSIAHGARKLPEFVDGVLVGVCDQWLLSAEDLERLAASWRAAPKRIHVAAWQEGAAQVSGPPVIFPGHLKGDLKGMDKQRGARQIIDRQIELVDYVELPSAAQDLDRPEDLDILNTPIENG